MRKKGTTTYHLSLFNKAQLLTTIVDKMCLATTNSNPWICRFDKTIQDRDSNMNSNANTLRVMTNVSLWTFILSLRWWKGTLDCRSPGWLDTVGDDEGRRLRKPPPSFVILYFVLSSWILRPTCLLCWRSCSFECFGRRDQYLLDHLSFRLASYVSLDTTQGKTRRDNYWGQPRGKPIRHRTRSQAPIYRGFI